MSGLAAIRRVVRRALVELLLGMAIWTRSRFSAFVSASEAWCLKPQTSHVMLSGTALAFWGALTGATVASLAVYYLMHVSDAGRSYFGQDFSQYPVLDDYKGSALIKSAEKVFYLCFYFFGVICAAMAVLSRRVPARISTLTFLVGASASIPALHILIVGITQRSHFSLLALLFAAAALASPPLISGFIAKPAPDTRPSNGLVMDSRLLRADLYIIAALTLLVVPVKIDYLASLAFAGNHAVSYLTGPALYGFADGLLPGRDFIAFYGQGPSYLFRSFLSTDPAAVYHWYVVFLTAFVLAFHVTCYFVLRDFYRDRALACLVSAALILTYHFGNNGVYWGPSALPVRFALIFILAAATASAITQPARARWLVLSGAIVGIALFWNTETGILMFLAVPASYVSSEISNKRNPWRVVFFVGSTAAAYLILSVGAFGIEALNKTFFASLVEPILLHTAGNWVGIVMKWDAGISYVYQLGAPALAIATGMAALICIRGTESSLARERAYLIFFSIVALAFTGKWINRSLDAAWWQNSFAFLAIGAWWARAALRSVYSCFPSKHFAAGLVVASVLTALLGFWNLSDRYQPNIKIGLAAYLELPTLVNIPRLLRSDNYSMGVPLDASDFNLANSLLKPGEPMLLLSDQDWLLLMRLGRAPKSYFLPLRDTFAPDHLTRSLDGANYVFVDRSSSFAYDWLRDDFVNRLQREFHQVGESTRFQVFGRR